MAPNKLATDFGDDKPTSRYQLHYFLEMPNKAYYFRPNQAINAPKHETTTGE